MTDTGPAGAARPFSLARLALAIVAPVVVYASLRPFQGWRDAGTHPFAYLRIPSELGSPFDDLLNLAGYLLLGLCLTLALFPRIRGLRAFAIGSLGLAACSLLVEAVQTYLPGRTPSVVDVIMNSLGAAFGAALAVRLTPWLVDRRGGARLRERWLVPGRVTEVGVLVLATWFVALFAQRTFLFGTGDFRGNLGASVDLSVPTMLYGATEVFIVAANLVAVSIVLRLVLADGVARVRWLLAFVVAALVARFVAQLAFWPAGAAFQWITQQAMLGLVCGVALALAALHLSRRSATIAALALIGVSLVVVNAVPPDPALWMQPSPPREGVLIALALVSRYAAKGWPLAAIAFLGLRVRSGLR